MFTTPPLSPQAGHFPGLWGLAETREETPPHLCLSRVWGVGGGLLGCLPLEDACVFICHQQASRGP